MNIKTRCSPEELQQWCRSEWDQLKKILDEAISFLPIEHQDVSYDDHELIVTLMGGGVTIQPEIYEAKSIGGIRQRPGWSIQSWKHEMETEYAPADFVVSDEKIVPTTLGAAVVATKLTFDVLMEDWGERLNLEEFVKEFQNETEEWSDMGNEGGQSGEDCDDYS